MQAAVPVATGRQAGELAEVARQVRLVEVTVLGGQTAPVRAPVHLRQHALEPAQARVALGRQPGRVAEPGDEMAMAAACLRQHVAQVGATIERGDGMVHFRGQRRDRSQLRQQGALEHRQACIGRVGARQPGVQFVDRLAPEVAQGCVPSARVAAETPSSAQDAPGSSCAPTVQPGSVRLA